MRNNISAEWKGDTLVVTNTGGGKVGLSNFAAASNSQVLFDVVDDAQTDGLNEPILLAASGVNMATQATAEFTGRTEETQMTFVSLILSVLVQVHGPIWVCNYQR